MKKLEDYDFYSISGREAAKLGPFGRNDGPVTVTCYRQKERWNSRRAAIAFYTAGMNSCGGSEQSRYAAVVAGLAAGSDDVTDEY